MADERSDVTLREFLQLQESSFRELVEAHWKSDDERWETFTNYIEKRLSDLNGEAGRLKVILDNSVASEKFSDYVTSQQDKQQQAERTQRLTFEEYQRTQATKHEEYQRTQTGELQRLAKRIDDLEKVDQYGIGRQKGTSAVQAMLLNLVSIGLPVAIAILGIYLAGRP